MPRLIEIILFLTPFVGFGIWRAVAPSERPPVWLVASAAVFVGLMLASLLWLRATDASDTVEAYVPAQLRGGQIVPGHAAPPGTGAATAGSAALGSAPAGSAHP